MSHVNEKPMLRFVRKHPDAQLPSFGTKGAAGMDVRSVEQVILGVGERRLVRTGLGCFVPEGYELQARPRSGIAFKNGVTVLNTPGTIDEDYRGELNILLINLGDDDFVVSPGDRIAQIVMAPVTRPAEIDWIDAQEVEQTERGEGGFGSTGTK